MNRIIFGLAGLLVSFGCLGQSILPPCPTNTSYWTDCFGAKDFTYSKYVGEFKDGRFNGQGTETYASGSKYVGEFTNSIRSGWGIIYDNKGQITESGYFENGRLTRSTNVDPTRFSNVESSSTQNVALASAQPLAKDRKPEERTVIGLTQRDKPYWTDVRLKRCARLLNANRCMHQQTGLPYAGEYEGDSSDGFGRLSALNDQISVGIFKKFSLHGLGIEYDRNGKLLKSGQWESGRLVNAFPLNHSEYPFDLELKEQDGYLTFTSKIFSVSGISNSSKSSAKGNWNERVARKVSADLTQWLSQSGGSIPTEVASPTFPAALNLTQDRWESDAEFDARVAAARRERQTEIDRVQADYKRRVDARNNVIIAAQRRRAELEKLLPSKKLDLIEATLKSEPIALKLVSTDFDPKRAVLYVNVTIDEREVETFEYKDSPLELRKVALTNPENLNLKPVFYIAESGEFGLRSIIAAANNLASAGVPTSASAQRQTPLTATISVPVPPPSSLVAQQSAIAVDRNQVEQILYREENEALRKRLDEQRRAQELILADQTNRAATEAARLKAQAESLLQRQKELEQQLAASVPPPTLAMGKRLALVIGNAKYSIRPLQNPENDANDVSTSLKGSGFDVLDLRNASLSEMRNGVRMFGDLLKSHDVGLVYYSGHGIEVKGRNYFIPVNADIKREDEVADQSLDVGLILEKMATANKSVNIMIVDACRDDPFGRSFRSSSSGLAAVEAPKGSLIAYATSPGKVAADGEGRNSPYTKHLVRAMQQPNRKIEEVFKEVRRAVQAETKELQTPWENTSLSGDFYFRVQK